MDGATLPQSGPGPVPVQFGGYEHSTADSPPVMGNFGFDSTPPRRRHLLMISDSGAIPRDSVLCDGLTTQQHFLSSVISHGWRHFVPSDSVLVLYTFYYRSFFLPCRLPSANNVPCGVTARDYSTREKTKKKGRQGVVQVQHSPAARGFWALALGRNHGNMASSHQPARPDGVRCDVMHHNCC